MFSCVGCRCYFSKGSSTFHVFFSFLQHHVMHYMNGPLSCQVIQKLIKVIKFWEWNIDGVVGFLIIWVDSRSRCVARLWEWELKVPERMNSSQNGQRDWSVCLIQHFWTNAEESCTYECAWEVSTDHVLLLYKCLGQYECISLLTLVVLLSGFPDIRQLENVWSWLVIISLFCRYSAVVDCQTFQMLHK